MRAAFVQLQIKIESAAVAERCSVVVMLCLLLLLLLLLLHVELGRC
jgi:hypothetical protein